MILRDLFAAHRSDVVSPAAGAAAILLGTVALALLPNAHESDLVKQPILVCGAVMLLGGALTMALIRRQGRYVRTAADIPLLLLLLLTLLQTLHAPDFRSARDAALLWGAFGIMYFAGTHAFGNAASIRFLMRSIVYVVAVAEAVAAAGLLVPGFPMGEIDSATVSRGVSPLGNASIFAAFLALMLPVLIAEGRRHRGPARVFHILLIVIAFALILAAGARGGLIVALASTGGYLYLSTGGRKSVIIGFGGLICALAVVILAVPSLHDRFLGFLGGSVSLDRRSVIWNAVWHGIRASPLTGFGTGSLESIVPIFRDPAYWMVGSEDIVRHAHNEILELWSDLGIAGPVIWLIIVLSTVRRGIAIACFPAGERRDLAAALVAGVGALLVENLAGVSLRSPAVGGYAWLFAGIIGGSTPGGQGLTARTVRLNCTRAVALLPAALATLWVVVTIVQQAPLIRSEIMYIDARVHESRNDQKAEEEYIAAYQLCRWNPQAAMSAAGVFFRRQRPMQSLEALDAVQQRFPLYPRSNLLRGMVLASLGNFRGADSSIRRELAIRSGPEGLHVQSIVARAVGDTAVERRALTGLLMASMRMGRDFFVRESCARLPMIAGADTEEVGALVAKARRQFAGPPP